MATQDKKWNQRIIKIKVVKKANKRLQIIMAMKYYKMTTSDYKIAAQDNKMAAKDYKTATKD